MASELDPQPVPSRDGAQSRAFAAEMLELLRGRPLWQLRAVRALVISMVHPKPAEPRELPPSN